MRKSDFFTFATVAVAAVVITANMAATRRTMLQAEQAGTQAHGVIDNTLISLKRFI